MNILKQKLIFLNSLSFYCFPKIKELFDFGLNSLVFQNIASLRRNARMSNLNWQSAKIKMYRLTKNIKIQKVFILILKNLSIVNQNDILSVDFSDFGNNFQVLMFAKQTGKGRAMPIYFDVIQYPLEKHYQNTFIINAIEELEKILGFKFKLVFDRGFACPSIIKHLSRKNHIFYIRIKKGKSIIVGNKKQIAKDITRNDLNILCYDLNLRLIISDLKLSMKESWYLITNDFQSTRENVIKIYYHRFEIEEFFRDAKRLLGLEYVNLQKELSLRNILWFVIAGMWFAWSIENSLTEIDEKIRKSMRLSIFRYILEKSQTDSLIFIKNSFIIQNLCFQKV